MKNISIALFLLSLLVLPQNGMAEVDFPFQGFVEYGLGGRIVSNDYKSDDILLNQAIVELEFSQDSDFASLNAKIDLGYDAVLDETVIDIRAADVTLFPYDLWELKAGRQIITWGTGDLVFVNDLFPKDWRSLFIGRSESYLKVPINTLKFSLFPEFGTLDLVFTPIFTPDTFIDGERLSYWGGDGITGNEFVSTKPDKTWENAEYHGRFAKNIGGLELALYGYKGFFKRPLGYDPEQETAIFPELGVYGASLRTQLFGGIFNIESGYYDSLDDRDGTNPLIENSILKNLIGFEKELIKNFTAAVQYFSEWMLSYDDYKKSVTEIGQPILKEENHDWITLRLTNLRKQQTLILSWFSYYSPAENDWYLRPKLTYHMNDQIQFTTGLNLFFGENSYTFFGQLEENSNVYFRVRYSY